MADKIGSSIECVCSWMANNKLKMNEDKTEVIKIGTLNKLKKASSPDTLSVMNCQVQFVENVKNLGFSLDSTLSFDFHISDLCRGLYLQLRRLGQIRPYVSTDSAKTLAVAMILSRIDYCNALLGGLPEDKIARLQRVQNCAAGLVMRKSKRDSASALLRSLHWLPVKARIEFNIESL